MPRVVRPADAFGGWIRVALARDSAARRIFAAWVWGRRRGLLLSALGWVGIGRGPGVEEQRDHQPRESVRRGHPRTALRERWGAPRGRGTRGSHNALLCTPEIQERREQSEKICGKCVNFYKLKLNYWRGIAFSNTKCMLFSRHISAEYVEDGSLQEITIMVWFSGYEGVQNSVFCSHIHLLFIFFYTVNCIELAAEFFCRNPVPVLPAVGPILQWELASRSLSYTYI